jgi:hypothetical protein
MDDATKKELRDIGNMVINWTRSYTRQIDPHGGNEYLIHEFNEEIHLNIVPYMVRLVECEYLTNDELSKFKGIIGLHLEGFVNLIREFEESEEE